MQTVIFIRPAPSKAKKSILPGGYQGQPQSSRRLFIFSAWRYETNE